MADAEEHVWLGAGRGIRRLGECSLSGSTVFLHHRRSAQTSGVVRGGGKSQTDADCGRGRVTGQHHWALLIP